MKYSPAGCIGVLLILLTVSKAEDDICRFFSNGTQIRDPESCSRYITCINFVSHFTDCKGTTPFYDKDTNKCVKTVPSDDTFCQISCKECAKTFIADPKSCKGYYYCSEEELATHGDCPDGTHFVASQQACVYKDDSECITKKFDFCGIVKNNVNFNDESSCEKYFTCKKGVLTSVSCSKQYYNAATGKCVQKSQVECANHPLPSNVCGTTKNPKKNVFVTDGATCRGYFFCTAKDSGPDTNPKWGQCPEDKFFDTSRSTCVNPLTVVCSEDRCDGRTQTFVSSGTKGCRSYLRCANGKTVEESSCGNLFFNEELSICTNQIITYASCIS